MKFFKGRAAASADLPFEIVATLVDGESRSDVKQVVFDSGDCPAPSTIVPPGPKINPRLKKRDVG